MKKGINKETELAMQILTRSTGGAELSRLKESAEEAKAISKEVKGKKEDVYLRNNATEKNVEAGKLNATRYLLFSTHGLLGGDFSGVAEPALGRDAPHGVVDAAGKLDLEAVPGPGVVGHAAAVHQRHLDKFGGHPGGIPIAPESVPPAAAASVIKLPVPPHSVSSVIG